MRGLALFVLLSMWSMISACSSVPEPIRQAPPAAPSLADLLAQPDHYHGSALRLGGVIAKVINTPEESQVEIVSRTLFRDGEPRQEDSSEGRFLAIVPGFLDPAIHAPGRHITVSGEFIGISERPLGEMLYRYPQLRVEAYYLWPQWRDMPRSDPFQRHPWYPDSYPYWPIRDPFWSPYWHPYPW